MAVTPLLKLLKAILNVVHTFTIMNNSVKTPAVVANNISRTLITATANLAITVVTLNFRDCYTTGIGSSITALRRRYNGVLSTCGRRRSV